MLSVHDLDYSYGPKTILRSVRLRAERGAVLSLVGPNGAGKSTLLKCVCGLLSPDRGSVEIGGKPLRAYSRTELARTVAYVPQGEGMRFPMTVFDAVLLGRRPYLHWRPRREDLDIVQSVLERLGLAHLALRDLNRLSGGERQTAMIARALVQEPKMLLLDEPNTYLDLKHQLRIMQLLRDLARERGLLALVVTHDLNLALRFSDRVAVLHQGTIAHAGGPDVLTEDVIREVYGVRARVRTEEDRPFVVPLQSERD